MSAVTAGALALNLAACDQIQSLWKSESPKPAAGIVVQPAPQPAEGKIEVAKSGDSRKAVEPPKVDEDAALAAKVKSAPGSLGEVLDALDTDHSYLLKGDVFTRDLIESWIEFKQEQMVQVSLRPHPYEFHLYFDA